MKKLIFFGVLGLFILASCNSTVTHTHNEHDHEAEGHNHATEDHDHSAHGDESGERHSHETAGSHLETAEAHSDEIILPKVKAEAAGVKASIIEPAPFQQVIKTSGQVLAAQGDESVAVATRCFFSWKSDGRNERRQRHTVGHHFFKQYSRR